MSIRMKHLKWNQTPDVLKTDVFSQLIRWDSPKLMSNRNKSGFVKPSYTILKALYYMLPSDDCKISSAGLTQNDEIQFTADSLSSGGSHLIRMKMDIQNQTGYIYHNCQAQRKGPMHCYHTIMGLALANLYYRPQSEFSKTFNELIPKVKSKKSNLANENDICSLLITAQDELYFDLKDNIIPFHENALDIITEAPYREQLVKTINNFYTYSSPVKKSIPEKDKTFYQKTDKLKKGTKAIKELFK